MSSEIIIPVILSGGSGTRLWPLSRKAYPKQFIDLTGGKSLFQQTYERVSTDDFTAPIILANQDHRFIVAEQVRQIGREPTAIVLEPVGRNTAPAALIATLMAVRTAGDALVLLLPSDQQIADREGFLRAVRTSAEAASRGRFITFGVRPMEPHTGYGYIEVEADEGDVMPVRRFVEKPTGEKAEHYLEAGNYYWNAGIFLFSAKEMIEAFERYMPSLLDPCRQALKNAREDLDFLRLDKKAYACCEDISIDYAIMEKADNISCVLLESDWTDLGSWSSLAELYPKDANGNASCGDVLFSSSKGCFAYSADDALIVVNGLSDVVVAVTRDVVLVTSKSEAKSVGDIAKALKVRYHSSTMHHVRVYRPWGWFESLITGERHQVKRIMVKPGAKLSLQSHRHRAEHWVVVQGTVRVTVGTETRLMSVNQSVYTPVGVKHRLENPGEEPALLIEVQTGEYLGEDDIIRYEDIYNRS